MSINLLDDDADDADDTNTGTQEKVIASPAETREGEFSLECNVCLEDQIPPLYTCRNGHLLCLGCHSNMTQKACPICKTAMPIPERNLLAEKLVLLLPTPTISCCYEGCKENLTVSEMARHRQTCPEKPRPCFFQHEPLRGAGFLASTKCTWTGPKREMYLHLMEQHETCLLTPTSAPGIQPLSFTLEWSGTQMLGKEDEKRWLLPLNGITPNVNGYVLVDTLIPFHTYAFHRVFCFLPPLMERNTGQKGVHIHVTNLPYHGYKATTTGYLGPGLKMAVNMPILSPTRQVTLHVEIVVDKTLLLEMARKRPASQMVEEMTCLNEEGPPPPPPPGKKQKLGDSTFLV